MVFKSSVDLQTLFIYPIEIHIHTEPKGMNKKVHRSIICDSSKMESTQMSAGGKMDKQITVKSYNGLLYSNVDE